MGVALVDIRRGVDAALRRRNRDSTVVDHA